MSNKDDLRKYSSQVVDGVERAPGRSMLRAVLQAATDAARAWNWQGPRPEGLFRAACETITKTHSDAWAMMTGQAGAPKPVLAGVHGQTVLHRRTKPGQPGARKRFQFSKR